ncbi:hypothetical protein SAMN06296065_1541, partial [Novosphingobium panipatense]
VGRYYGNALNSPTRDESMSRGRRIHSLTFYLYF